MSDDAEDQDSKTEEPTEKRKEEFRKKGMEAYSKEVSSTMVFLTLILVLNSLSASLYQNLSLFYSKTFGGLRHWPGDEVPFYNLFLPLLKPVLASMGIILFVAFLVPIVAHVLQKGIEAKPEAAEPSFDKLNPISGLMNMLSKETLVRTLTNMLKTFGMMIVFYITLKPFVAKIVFASGLPLEAAVESMGTVFTLLVRNATIFLVLIAGTDYFMKWRMMHTRMMMSRQELKDEFKDSDGNPEVKNKIRQIQRDRSKRKINSEVPKATVVITNPTHYSVAIIYKKGQTDVPRVLVKGVDYLAKQIREKAREHKIPIVENPPLTRAIYREVKEGREIPKKYFKPVAKIIATILRLEAEKKKQQQDAQQRQMRRKT